MKLSIVIPVYNEEKTVGEILRRVAAVELPWEKEIIVVNDGSTDNSKLKISHFAKASRDKQNFIYVEQENKGKGAAVLAGIKAATGDYVVIQDADLEYDPRDIVRLIKTAEKYPGLIIYGSRLMAPPVLWGKNKTPLLLHYFGNRLLSLITTILYGQWVTDMETCYKLFPRKIARKFKINARGFEFEPEITAKFLRAGYKIKEIPIMTKPRGYDQGKKLNTWRDGWRALTTLIKYRFTD